MTFDEAQENLKEAILDLTLRCDGDGLEQAYNDCVENNHDITTMDLPTSMFQIGTKAIMTGGGPGCNIRDVGTN